MKKSEKETEIRAAAKIKCMELKTRMAYESADLAHQRAEIMKDRAAELLGETDEKRRHDIFAHYRVMLATLADCERAMIAQMKLEQQEIYKSCKEMCAAATDDPETEQPAPLRSIPANTVWVNGEQWQCVAVARRILNKLPKLNYPQESFVIEMTKSYDDTACIEFKYINIIYKEGGIATCELNSRMTEEVQNESVNCWLKEVDVMMKKAKEIKEEEEDDNE